MLRSLNTLRKFKIRATDGDLGGVFDFFFDDRDWNIRYIVVDTGKWLPGRQVLISPVSVRGMDWYDRRIDLQLTREQIKDSPSVGVHFPISRQLEERMIQYYAWPVYWTDYGGATLPQADNSGVVVAERPHVKADPTLRSEKHVRRYHIHANDGSIGHVDDFLCDDENWTIRYMVVDTQLAAGQEGADRAAVDQVDRLGEFGSARRFVARAGDEQPGV